MAIEKVERIVYLVFCRSDVSPRRKYRAMQWIRKNLNGWSCTSILVRHVVKICCTDMVLLKNVLDSRIEELKKELNVNSDRQD